MTARDAAARDQPFVASLFGEARPADRATMVCTFGIVPILMAAVRLLLGRRAAAAA